MKYFSVVIPYVEKNATIWHPIDPVGSFSVITRGCFDTEIHADAWALKNIPGHTYTVKEYDSTWIDE